MPILDWIGKKAVLNHHNEVPFRLLRCNEELSVGDSGSGNLLIQRDNDKVVLRDRIKKKMNSESRGIK